MTDDTKPPAPTPLTDKTLDRMRALVKGNGLAAERVTVLETAETIHAVHGSLHIEPHLDVVTRVIHGRLKGRDQRLLPDFATLESEIASIRKDFDEGSEWLEKAREEIDKTAGKGWGEDGTDVAWDAKSTVLGATEPCNECRGSGTRPCPECQGLGFKTCIYCEGRGKELCPHCAGNGQDPAQPGAVCPVCHGEHYAECRYCHLSGKLECEQCHNRGTLPCSECNGTGYHSREAKIAKKATLRFSLSTTSELPSGLLRMMQRAGMDKIGGALADIETELPEVEEGKKQDTLLLTARIPYAEIKMKIGSKTGKIIAFGKTGRLSGVPPFLDDILGPSRALLLKAAKGEVFLEKILGLRVMKDTLRLRLAGKTNPNELRRLYPVGLTPGVAKEMMVNMGLALRSQTKSKRQMIGWAYAAACAALFSGLMFTPLLDMISSGRGFVAALSVQILVLGGAMAGGWMVVANAARWALKQKYPDAEVGRQQAVGRTGLYVMASLFGLYVLIFLLSGHASLFAG